ncbi:MAG TPA: alpha-galactosidase [Bacteroidota bacterium]|nr:alpha-galactosidase [Bacteroidota bacterium]
MMFRNYHFEMIFGMLLAFSVTGLSAATERLVLQNDRVSLNVIVQKDQLLGDELRTVPSWSEEFGVKKQPAIATDADFAIDVMYTDWQAPGKVNNAENPVLFTKKDFQLVDHRLRDSGSVSELVLFLKGRENPIDLRITYRLKKGEFFVRRNIAVMDTAFGHHFLRWMWTRSGYVNGVKSILKSGGFGQPVALLLEHGGAFFGLEYPTAENSITALGRGEEVLKCGQEFGEQISGTWLESEWVVEGITPDTYVKNWFFKYVDAIRVAPLRPYTLYNSWYDLRSPEYPKVPQDHWMSEESALGMAKLLRENMIEKHDIRLDAFVLDDGWDVYESDWLLRQAQWPRGLLPLADELKKTNTTLGLWMGPTGGYSFRMRRINWMKDHGYEVVGTTRDNTMLCLAGTKYSQLFRQRISDFVKNDGVGYFKWDGIQFSCSEPDHGHPIDIYSRRAVMQSVIEKCETVRRENPDVFLNITSGTWLSPWWVKYANTIWMQGADYGFSDVPSISQRDAAITYRDFILYDDFKNLDLWFPIQNLMTHGIIKGKLESTGSYDEPLDKFTDDALLYCARGVTMFELYISPDILSEGEWNSLAASLSWARDRFPVLSTTWMVGGNPMKRETYGYVHFRDDRGIIAVRNPFMNAASLPVRLSVEQGLDPKATSLVLEEEYPVHRILPQLYRAGENISIPLEGYETAVYELYPVSAATVPLVAGGRFDVVSDTGVHYAIRYSAGSGDVRILNPSIIQSATLDGRSINPKSFSFPPPPGESSSLIKHRIHADPKSSSQIQLSLNITGTVSAGEVALLLTPDSAQEQKSPPAVSAMVDSQPARVEAENQEGISQWYHIPVESGKHTIVADVHPGKNETLWKGTAAAWLVAQETHPTREISFVLKNACRPVPMPPHPWNTGESRVNLMIGSVHLSSQK